jgi:TolB protein
MMKKLSTLIATTCAAAAGIVVYAQNPPAQPPQQQPPVTDVRTVITGSSGLPPKYAVPDFIAAGADAESATAAKVIGQVLWDDLNFEREFYLIARDTYRTIPQPATLDQVPLDRWKEIGAEGLVIGSVRKTPSGFTVQMKLIEVGGGRTVLNKEYTGTATTSPRFFAHTISDEIHQQQVQLRGVARTKLAFTSDRDGERVKGAANSRDIQNIYVSDYDGANQSRVTITKSLDITPQWSPDARYIAYTSYRSGFPDILVADIRRGTPATNPAKGSPEKQNYLPAWSPDGSKLAFMSNRDGNPEIYVVNRDGSGMRRLTNHPENDVTPTWSPTGNQIAFTSNRSGNPQIWIMNEDGSGQQRITSESWCDRPTWSPAPFNEIAYASRSGGGYDIRIFDFATRNTRTVTDGVGSNESPAFSPNGRHIAYVSTRAGKAQIFTIARDGKDRKQITTLGENRYPHWSN